MRSDREGECRKRFKFRFSGRVFSVLVRGTRRMHRYEKPPAFIYPSIRMVERERPFPRRRRPDTRLLPAKRAGTRTYGDDARRAAPRRATDDQSRAGGRPDGRGRASTRRWQPTFPPRVTERPISRSVTSLFLPVSELREVSPVWTSRNARLCPRLLRYYVADIGQGGDD